MTEVEPNESYGEMLRRLRLRSHLLIRQVASRVMLSVTSVSDVERGARQPFTAQQTTRIAQAIGLNHDEKVQLIALSIKGRGRLELLVPHGTAEAVLVALAGLAAGHCTMTVSLVKSLDQ